MGDLVNTIISHNVAVNNIIIQFYINEYYICYLIVVLHGKLGLKKSDMI